MKKIIILAATVIVASSLFYYLYWSPVYRIKPLNLIPPQASFILASSRPIDSWQELSESDIWAHLKKNPQFAEITDNANYLDSLFWANEWLDFVGNKELLIAAHPVQDTYDYLYVMDLARASRLQNIKYYMQNFVDESYKLTYRKYEGVEITEFYDIIEKETLYLSFIENLLVISYSPTLIEAVIRQHVNPEENDRYFLEITDQLGYKGQLRAYVNLNSFMDYLGQFALDNPSMDMIKTSLRYGGFALNLGENKLGLGGITNINDTVNSYLKALYMSGEGSHEFLKVIPQTSPYFVSLGFNDFPSFVENLESTLRTNPNQEKAYMENRNLVESFLKIDLNEVFIDWVDNEAVMLQANASSKTGINEYALLLKAKDIEQAKTGLGKIRQQIKKKTPVKVKSVTYKGHEIHYMAMKGFFKVFLGKLFDKFDKPYYCTIGNWVIFSNHPHTLKNIIDAVEDETTLYYNDEFQEHYEELKDHTSVFAYINMPDLFDDLRPLMEQEDWWDMQKNKDYITCFKHMSLQLSPQDGDIFHTGLYTSFEVPAINGYTSKKALPSIVPKYETPHQALAWSETYKKVLKEIDRIAIPDLTQDEYKAYYENGNLQYEVDLKNGWKHGRFESYFENGTEQFKGRYKNDKKDGTWRVYNEQGELITKIKYDEGIQEK
ncbi:DUF3352 domain-containing protein [Fulvivirga sp. 29W222]|uniref:DUF3352 domain-containing protein n=1 Tax=Fulvivirga marina TaxID=2494733 RepID=A0A937KCU1_9BACT|nr:DUF3352 domain-containing protein [Fulvivirga marina]MBL6445563.1 DUF3352 domain-containing protein [Fulvivirga marina]